MNELWTMWKAAMRERWGHTAALQAMIYNVNRGKHSPAKKPDDFNPMALHLKYSGERGKLEGIPREASPLEK